MQFLLTLKKYNDMQTIKKLFKNLTKEKQSINLKQVINCKIIYIPIPFDYNNVGTYKK